MEQKPIAYQNQGQIYYADSCEPLKAAASEGEISLCGWSRGNYPGIALPDDRLHEVRSLGIWDAQHNQSWGLGLHCNEGIEFTYLLRGQLGFEVDGRYWNLKRGALTVTRPWQFHSVGNPDVTASQLIWLILDVHVRRPHQLWQWPDWLIISQTDLTRLTTLLRHNEQPVWQGNRDVERCFIHLAELLETESPEQNESKLKLYINHLIISILDLLTDKNIALDDHLSTTQHSVEVFLASLPRQLHQDWDLNSMAATCGLSRSQFATYCKQLTNMSPIDYLTTCRIQAAKQRLTHQPSQTITDIAYYCGFSSSQYFATVFKAHTGLTPSAFRKQIKKSTV